VCIDTGGNLGDIISENRKKKTGLEISDLAQILMQVSQGLKYIHAQGLVHLDIKPGMATLTLLSQFVFLLRQSVATIVITLHQNVAKFISFPIIFLR